MQLLNNLCNTTQSSVQLRDACYGCFFRAGSLPPGPPQLVALSQCATLYLVNTIYQPCAQELASIIVGLKPVQPSYGAALKPTLCTFGYCEFVRCIRRANSYNLVIIWLKISLLWFNINISIGFQINTCFLANLVARDFNVFAHRINFYTNITACILARTRCSDVNPITGDLQRQQGSLFPPGITNGAGTGGYFFYNALQIARNGDMKILSFPPQIVTGNVFCSNYSSISLQQSPYDSRTCLYS